MAAEWYQQTAWTEANERLFEEKLKRARDKQQYLRIQACTLASTCPEVALALLDRYFAFPVDSDNAQAHVDRATTLTALERYEEAVASYEAALARETQFPNCKTNAWLDLPYLIATRNLHVHFDRALELLKEPGRRLMFPFQLFRWHAAYALIALERDDLEQARAHAAEALSAAECRDSGFRHHASVGLVGDAEKEVLKKLASLLARSCPPAAATKRLGFFNRLARAFGSKAK